ncbi:hypothetical protein [Prochlorococcus sp. MIT 1306]|uniref:hypothetical protein n=2 Tax=Prochlorococcus TaxID=1218 RepID=UPI0007B3C46D|nr:hypothetical protein [Prochlorococcus sp. MIT 1306]KZR65520.1 hypothetical protein PMIT1306_00432 [Prochlorococcus sp. MIT 1306]
MHFKPLLTLAATTAICAPLLITAPAEAQEAGEKYTMVVVMTSYEVEDDQIESSMVSEPQQEAVIDQEQILASMGVNAKEIDTISYDKRLALINSFKTPLAESESLAVQSIPMVTLKGCRRAGEALKYAFTLPSSMLKTTYQCIQNY